jgi:hypothetical protein
MNQPFDAPPRRMSFKTTHHVWQKNDLQPGSGKPNSTAALQGRFSQPPGNAPPHAAELRKLIASPKLKAGQANALIDLIWLLLDPGNGYDLERGIRLEHRRYNYDASGTGNRPPFGDEDAMLAIEFGLEHYVEGGKSRLRKKPVIIRFTNFSEAL